MSPQNLEEFWDTNKQAIGKALPQGTDALAQVLQTGADAFGLAQQVQDAAIQWITKAGDIALMFCVVPDPRDLDRVLNIFSLARDKRPRLTAIFVHQWTDGEGNWDAFLISARTCLHHADRITGSNTVQERGPGLREDIYTLFACDREFPAPGSAQWAQLLAGPMEDVAAALEALAAQHACTQTVRDDRVQWANSEGRLEAQFYLLPEVADIEAVIRMYQQIRETRCPVSFVFVKCERPGMYDIFRLSARSYLEHHNQAKAWAGTKATVTGVSGTPTTELAGLRWVPRWASHVGCIKGCLGYLGINVSDAWLFGATGHAFVLNISPDLCPSGPTDWDTSRFLSLGRNVGYLVEGVDEFCPKQDADLRKAQEKAWEHVKSAIAQGRPCYGWELDIPEYFVIYGHDEAGYYISGPGCDEGKGPIPWRNLGQSEIGMVLVASIRPAAPSDDRQTVREALACALDMGHNRQKWTDRSGGLRAYEEWIRAMEGGRAGRFGLGYNAAVWAESRRFAVEFLQEAQRRLKGDLDSLFEEAIANYQTVARMLKAVSDTYPFKECANERVLVDEQSRAAVTALKQARDAETDGLAVLARLLERTQPA
jgi:hypothetical protein